jgi:NitT/TauT family transport system permease protein
VDPLFISSPSEIWARLREWAGDGTLSTNTWITVEEIILGFLLGASVGIVTGFVFAVVKVLGDVLDPYMIALYSIPKVALAPLFIIWFGIDLKMKVLLAAATVFFLVYLNTSAGVRSVDRGLIDAVRLMGGSTRQIVFKILLPGSMGGVITGLRVGVPYALIGAVVGELVASNRGLGFLMLNSASQFDTAGVFAALAVITVIALILNLGVNVADRRSSRWKPVES